MVKKVLIAGLAVVLVLGIGLFVWARAVLGRDTVRTVLAAQLTKSLGQPVTVGSVAATIYPRVTVRLGDVSIGAPARITVGSLDVGTDLRALLSRRIEHASLRLSGARIELPLPDFTIAPSPAPQEAASESGSPVEIVSVDEVVLNDVEIVSGGRTLRGDVEVVPQGKGLVIRRIALGADRTRIDVTGRITDLAGPSGDLTVVAGALDFNELQQFATDFAGGAGLTAASPASSGSTTPSASATGPGMNVTISLQADGASLGTLTIDKLGGKARITSDAMTLEPVSFGVFGGKYDGTLALSLASTPEFRLNAKLSGIDMAAATAFAGSPNTITGRLGGSIEVTGQGMDAPSVMKTARGTARIDITDGTVKNLGLVHTIVVATSGRADARSAAGGGSRDEPFSRLGGTLNVSGGFLSTPDLAFESKDLLLAAGGAMKLDGTAMNLQGQVQLSDELSKQAGRDLVRYTQEGGRVTLPATITGSASNPQVRIDVASMAKRAITNRANEEAQKAIKKGLGGLLRRK
jgi:uncharacterized protein involved in outer membrane biogenesis